MSLFPSIIFKYSRRKCVNSIFFHVLYPSTAPPLPPSFSFDLLQVAEQQVELCWSDLSGLNSLNISSFEIFLQYREEKNGELFQGEHVEERRADEKERGSSAKKVVEVPISLSCRGVTVAGLSPGSVYSFTLRAARPDGSSWTLGQTQTAYTSPSTLYLFRLCTHTHTHTPTISKYVFFFFFTGPPSPQNMTVGSRSVDQILVHWTIPDAPLTLGWVFLVSWVDLSTEQERIVGMTNISKESETSLLQSYTAVIGGLASHRKYRIRVSTVTQHGMESSEQAAVTVQTGKR